MSAVLDRPPIEYSKENMASPIWRLDNIYFVLDDQGREVPFQMRPEQRELMLNLHPRNLILKARQLGFCCDGATRVLTADLRWVQIKDLTPGTEVVAVDEERPGPNGSSRKMRTATVQACFEVQREAYKISFDDGRSVICSAKHPWLSKKIATVSEWRSIAGNGPGREKSRLTVGTFVRWITKPWGDATADDLWMGGIFDGEGSLSKAEHVTGLNASQREGPVWDRMVRFGLRYHAKIENDIAERLTKHGKVPVPKLAFGRMNELFEVLGKTRPTRFIGRRWWEGKDLPGKKTGIGWAQITAIEPVGEQTLYDLQTSTGTYIAEGFVSHNTTGIDLLALDQAIFNKNFKAVIIADTIINAMEIFRTKIEFPFMRLPKGLRDALGVATDSKTEFIFGNGSSVSVTNSARGGTLQFLHISEFGKICAKFPEKAQEIITGSFPAVVQEGGMVFIESTAKGQAGKFYDMTMTALRRQQSGEKLTSLDFRLHFFPWWRKQTNRLNSAGVLLTQANVEYFLLLSLEHQIVLDNEQKAWYVKTAETLGDDMKSEHPSFPEEAFEVSIEGAIFSKEMAHLRRNQLIGAYPWSPGKPVNTFWDLGVGKGNATAIWCHQRIQGRNRLIDYIHAEGEGYGYFVNKLNQRPYVWGVDYLPHDAKARRAAVDVFSASTTLADLGRRNQKIVPKVPFKNQGIEALRSFLMTCEFDSKACVDGIKALDGYQREWDEKGGRWSDHPLHNWASNGTDALMQGAQGYEPDQEWASTDVYDEDPWDPVVGY